MPGVTISTALLVMRRWAGAGLLSVGALLVTATGAGSQAISDEARIREARVESNRAIARHDVPGVVAILDEHYQVSVSGGTFLRGRAEMADALSSRFSEFPDAVYVRTPETVEVSTAQAVAAEIGTWEGSWTTATGSFRTGGRYAAYWREVDGVWKIHSELFVPLFCDGPGCH